MQSPYGDDYAAAVLVSAGPSDTPAASISVPLRFLRSHPYLQMILLPLDFFANRCYIKAFSGFAPKGAAAELIENRYISANTL